MTEAYRDVEKVGDLGLDESLVKDFLALLTSMDLPKTHDLGEESGEDNPSYNKYIVRDDIFSRIFFDEDDYRFFLRRAIHTFLLPRLPDLAAQSVVHRLVGAVHGFFTEYYQRFFLLRVSVSITAPGSFMHYHRDLAGEDADRFLVDLSDPEAKDFGIEVEDRLYPLRRLGIYKLDTTRPHRAANYGQKHNKVSLIIQCIADLRGFAEYQRKHVDVFLNAHQSARSGLPGEF